MPSFFATNNAWRRLVVQEASIGVAGWCEHVALATVVVFMLMVVLVVLVLVLTWVQSRWNWVERKRLQVPSQMV
jgi:hypothetical protein